MRTKNWGFAQPTSRSRTPICEERAKLRGAPYSTKMPGVVDDAVRILSDALDVAAADVIGLSSLSLTDVFSDLR